MNNFTWNGNESISSIEITEDDFIEEREIEVPDLSNAELNETPTFEEASTPKRVEYPLVLIQASNTAYIETIKKRILENPDLQESKGVTVSYISSNKEGGTGVVFYKGLFNIYIYDRIRRYGVEVFYYPRKGEKVSLKDKNILLETHRELFDEARYC